MNYLLLIARLSDADKPMDRMVTVEGCSSIQSAIATAEHDNPGWTVVAGSAQ